MKHDEVAENTTLNEHFDFWTGAALLNPNGRLKEMRDLQGYILVEDYLQRLHQEQSLPLQQDPSHVHWPKARAVFPRALSRMILCCV